MVMVNILPTGWADFYYTDFIQEGYIDSTWNSTYKFSSDMYSYTLINS